MKHTGEKPRVKRNRSSAAAVLLTAVVVLLAALIPSSACVSADTPRDGEYSLRPRVSEGVTLSPDSDSAYTVRAHEENGMLVFDETKTISFTASFGKGWSRCEKYSYYFSGLKRSSITPDDRGGLEVRFEAVAGENVPLDKLDMLQINAACAELPKLYIDAERPFAEIDKENWVGANFRLESGTKRFTSGSYRGTGSVKGRGNSSWNYDKKPYSIKLSEKASLLDIPKTKKYAVIPSNSDGSLIRNYITYKACLGLVGIGYVPKCELVEVYLNGQYNGIYLLTERVDVGKTKVDIEEADENNITGGYLLEKNCRGKFSARKETWFDCPYWANQVEDRFELHAPQPEGDLKKQMVNYLVDWVNAIHTSIMDQDGDEYLQYVDVSSWVDFIIVQEISKNPDGCFKTSCWLYKDRDDDHMYMTAPWDFDFAYGLVSWTNASTEHNDGFDCPPANTAEDFMVLNSSAPWMKRLYETRPFFRAALMERYALYRKTVIPDMFRLINEEAAYLSIVYEPNQKLWKRGFETGITRLRSWLESRIEWLDSQWLNVQQQDAQLPDAQKTDSGRARKNTGN